MPTATRGEDPRRRRPPPPPRSSPSIYGEYDQRFSCIGRHLFGVHTKEGGTLGAVDARTPQEFAAEVAAAFPRDKPTVDWLHSTYGFTAYYSEHIAEFGGFAAGKELVENEAGCVELQQTARSNLLVCEVYKPPGNPDVHVRFRQNDLAVNAYPAKGDEVTGVRKEGIRLFNTYPPADSKPELVRFKPQQWKAAPDAAPSSALSALKATLSFLHDAASAEFGASR